MHFAERLVLGRLGNWSSCTDSYLLLTPSQAVGMGYAVEMHHLSYQN